MSGKVILSLVSALSLVAAPRDSKELFELLKKGAALSHSDADKLEGRLKKKPADGDARIQLLAYYTAKPAAENRESRSRHILWVLENDPVERLGLKQIRTGVLQLNCEGDPLADRAAFDRAMPTLLKMAGQPGKHRDAALKAMEYCAPEQVERFLLDGGDRTALGRFYAGAALGIVGQDYEKSEPLGSDDARRQSPLAKRALESMEKAVAEGADGDFLNGAASGLLHDGALLWADGKLDWDYTPVGRRLLPLAVKLNPDNLRLLTLTAELPVRGQCPPMIIRVGGSAQQQSLTRQPKPVYPVAAKMNGIQGTVRMEALVGTDGKVWGLRVLKGPPELVQSSLDAVRRWEYKPTLLNGRPCFVFTVVDVNYVLGF